MTMYVGENNDYSRETRLRIPPERNAFLVEEEKPGGIIAYKEISPTGSRRLQQHRHQQNRPAAANARLPLCPVCGHQKVGKAP